MGFIISIILLSLATLTQAQQIKSARLIDLVIRDYTFRSYSKNFRTGKLHRINLPSNLSGINVDTVRFRCGSLHRYGAKIKEFHLNTGLHVHLCTKRVLLLRQNLGPNWSSLYYDNYELSGYQLISPVLGLLAYNIGGNVSLSELAIQSGKKPIVIDFSTTELTNTSSGIIPLCARFDQDGKVSLSNQARRDVCVATRDGHFGLVVESPLLPLKRKVSKWKLAVGGAIGGALGGLLLSLLMIAVFVKAKKKRKRMEELERMVYEEEALQVSMVGHVRALTASATRTLPTIEHHHQYN
ncbi:hypothetical protein ACS0TY_004450 [Phlomoides rotata]